MSDITPKRIAEHLHGRDLFINRAFAGFVDVAADGAVAKICFTPNRHLKHVYGTRHFRAVVVPGDGPVVVASPEFLAAARALYRWHVAASSLSADQFAELVYDVDDALAALTPEQVSVLAGDEQDAQAERDGGQ